MISKKKQLLILGIAVGFASLYLGDVYHTPFIISLGIVSIIFCVLTGLCSLSL